MVRVAGKYLVALAVLVTSLHWYSVVCTVVLRVLMTVTVPERILLLDLTTKVDSVSVSVNWVVFVRVLVVLTVLVT